MDMLEYLQSLIGSSPPAACVNRIENQRERSINRRHVYTILPPPFSVSTHVVIGVAQVAQRGANNRLKSFWQYGRPSSPIA